VLESGIHATIAGVVLAFVIPWPRVTWLEHLLRPWCTYLILPLFALAGIGFTVSLFVTELTFENTSDPRGAAARLGILLASVVAGVAGAVLVYEGTRPLPT
jgi:NhaA family Na+:H+ antiporter